jgi:hypothetical protein
VMDVQKCEHFQAIIMAGVADHPRNVIVDGDQKSREGSLDCFPTASPVRLGVLHLSGVESSRSLDAAFMIPSAPPVC